MEQVTLARRGDRGLANETIAEMYQLRHEVFHDRLGWDVNSDNGMEYDEFDCAHAVYVIAKSDANHVVGCWRGLPSEGPNMLRDVFPQLLHGQPAPQQADVWELSRFAVAAPGEGGEAQGFGFSSVPVQMMRAWYTFARRNGICRYVTVTTVSIERLIRKLGLTTHRLGPPIRIGKVLTVACTLEVDSLGEFALFGTLPEHAERIAA